MIKRRIVGCACSRTPQEFTGRAPQVVIVGSRPRTSRAKLERFLPKLLDHADAAVRSKACNLVGNLCRHSASFYGALAVGSPGQSSLAAVVRAASDGDAATRKFACFALGNAAFHSAALYADLAPAVAPLVAALRGDDDEKTRANAAGALGNLARNGGQLARHLVDHGAPNALLKAARADPAAAPRRIALFSLGASARVPSAETSLDRRVARRHARRVDGRPVDAHGPAPAELPRRGAPGRRGREGPDAAQVRLAAQGEVAGAGLRREQASLRAPHPALRSFPRYSVCVEGMFRGGRALLRAPARGPLLDDSVQARRLGRRFPEGPHGRALRRRVRLRDLDRRWRRGLGLLRRGGDGRLGHLLGHGLGLREGLVRRPRRLLGLGPCLGRLLRLLDALRGLRDELRRGLGLTLFLRHERRVDRLRELSAPERAEDAVEQCGHVRAASNSVISLGCAGAGCSHFAYHVAFGAAVVATLCPACGRSR